VGGFVKTSLGSKDLGKTLRATYLRVSLSRSLEKRDGGEVRRPLTLGGEESMISKEKQSNQAAELFPLHVAF